MKWVRRVAAGLWAFFTVASCAFLWSVWFVETPGADGPTLLPLAQGDFIATQSDGDPQAPTINQISHFLWNPDHVKELEMAPGVERVVLQKQEPVPITRSVEYLVVDGVKIWYDEDEDPVKGPILARVLRDAARIEWGMLWDRALAGTAAWAAALAAMLGLTWLLRRKGTRSKRVTERE
mgnify:CR=1 FL=1